MGIQVGLKTAVAIKNLLSKGHVVSEWRLSEFTCLDTKVEHGKGTQRMMQSGNSHSAAWTILQYLLSGEMQVSAKL